jgi:hypothetical protein
VRADDAATTTTPTRDAYWVVPVDGTGAGLVQYAAPATLAANKRKICPAIDTVRASVRGGRCNIANHNCIFDDTEKNNKAPHPPPVSVQTNAPDRMIIPKAVDLPRNRSTCSALYQARTTGERSGRWEGGAERPLLFCAELPHSCMSALFSSEDWEWICEADGTHVPAAPPERFPIAHATINAGSCCQKRRSKAGARNDDAGICPKKDDADQQVRPMQES